MTMMPGPMMAASVRSRRRQVRRGAISLTRMVPKAPCMSPTCISSRTAEVGTSCESSFTGSRSVTADLYPGARFDPSAPVLRDQGLQQVVNGDGADQYSGIGHGQSREVVV